MKKSVENLKTSKITGGLRHPLKTRQKFETDRYPNEAEMGQEQETIRAAVHTCNKRKGRTIRKISLEESKSLRTGGDVDEYV